MTEEGEERKRSWWKTLASAFVTVSRSRTSDYAYSGGFHWCEENFRINLRVELPEASAGGSVPASVPTLAAILRLLVLVPKKLVP